MGSGKKLAITLQWIKRLKPVADICQEHKIFQSQNYRRRDRFLTLPHFSPAGLKAKPLFELVADKCWVLDNLDSPEVKSLDIRSSREYKRVGKSFWKGVFLKMEVLRWRRKKVKRPRKLS